jgi:antirestriction protein ArdC
MKNQESRNVYQMVTDRVIEQMQQGIIPWHQPWTGAGLLEGGAINYVSRKPYSLLNQFLLGRDGEWLTFKQIQERKGRIKRGVKAHFVVFYQMNVKQETVKVKNEQGEIEERTKEKCIPVLRYYNVFHIDECEGIESKVQQVEQQPENQLQPVERAEQVINSYVERENLKFNNQSISGDAYYSPMRDEVVVPKLSQYQIAEEYYSTTFHELTHSTMKEGRCNRRQDGAIAAFGGEDYSREELVAELGSAMLCKQVGIDCEKAFKNSVAYIQCWMKALKNDNKAIVWAAARAEKAAKYIMGEQ